MFAGCIQFMLFGARNGSRKEFKQRKSCLSHSASFTDVVHTWYVCVWGLFLVVIVAVGRVTSRILNLLDSLGNNGLYYISDFWYFGFSSCCLHYLAITYTTERYCYIILIVNLFLATWHVVSWGGLTFITNPHTKWLFFFPGIGVVHGHTL